MLNASNRFGTASLATIFLAITPLFLCPSTARANAAQSAVSQRPPVIVIGFVGGFVRRDNTAHAEVQFAQRLHRSYPTGVDVEVFENRHVKQAHRRVLALLTASTHGVLTSEEKRDARIVLYGHSWGGAAAVQLARALQEDGIPVLLTVEVDSISKPWQNASIIPSNVLEAVNFYQPHGVFRGIQEIRAQDPSRTRIVADYRFDYARSTLACSGYPWWDRYVFRAHTLIECDPAVWNRVDSLITALLPHPTPSPAEVAKNRHGSQSHSASAP
jgi:hypothetical protein